MALNVGLIGLKGHQGVVIHGVESMAEARITGVADSDPAAFGSLKESAATDDATKYYTDHREMLADQAFDVIGICETHDRQAEVIIDSARAGAHVLAEKPLAGTLDELNAVKKAVAKAGVHLSMLLTMRYDPTYIAIRDSIQRGDIGRVCQAAGQKSYRLGTRPEWMRDRATFAGIIPFVGIHAMDFVAWTTGLNYTEVMAWQGTIGHPELRDMEDTCCVLAKLNDEVPATIRLDFLRPEIAPTHGDDRLRVAGSEGVIETIEWGSKVHLVTKDREYHELPLGEHQDQFADFVSSIREGTDCVVPAADCYRITEVVLKAREAAEKGVPIRI